MQFASALLLSAAVLLFAFHPLSNLDIVLQIVSALLTLSLGFIGVEMANNPPATDLRKRQFRVVFFALAVLIIAVNIWQGERNAAEKKEISDKSDQAQQYSLKQYNSLKTQYDEISGRLKSIDSFVQRPPPSLTPEQVSASIRAMVGPTPHPAYGNLKQNTDELGMEVIHYADEREKERPPQWTSQYNKWVEENDGLDFLPHDKLGPRIMDLYGELQKHEFRDPQLDRLIENFQEILERRQKDFNAAARLPEAFHLSIEEIREIGVRLRFLATQIP